MTGQTRQHLRAAPNGVAPDDSAAVGARVPPAEQPAASAGKRRSRRRLILLAIVAIVVVVGAWQAYTLYSDSLHYVSTDNAQVTGQPVPVGSMNAGRVTSIGVTIGSAVRKGQPLADLELPSQVGVTQTGAPRLEFLGDANSHTIVTSPIDGVVIALPGAVGGTVAAGAPIVTLIDPAQLWVTANVDETEIWRLRLGQEVSVRLDALNTTVSGRVAALTPATASSFSLLPQANTTGNFTKVTQVVPVRVALRLGDRPGLLGSSAAVRIHVE